VGLLRDKEKGRRKRRGEGKEGGGRNTPKYISGHGVASDTFKTRPDVMANCCGLLIAVS